MCVQERSSYRDMGAFREFALQRLTAHGFDTEAAAKSVRVAMALPEAFEAAHSYEIWNFKQVSRCPPATSHAFVPSHACPRRSDRLAASGCFHLPHRPNAEPTTLPFRPPRLLVLSCTPATQSTREHAPCWLASLWVGCSPPRARARTDARVCRAEQTKAFLKAQQNHTKNFSLVRGALVHPPSSHCTRGPLCSSQGALCASPLPGEAAPYAPPGEGAALLHPRADPLWIRGGGILVEMGSPSWRWGGLCVPRLRPSLLPGEGATFASPFPGPGEGAAAPLG